MTKSQYGKSRTNPIRVKGASGEIEYLEELVTITDQPLIFHRLLSQNTNRGIIDVYEVVSSDGKNWDLLYFDMYASSNSELVPEGYKFADHKKLLQTFIDGVNNPKNPAYLIECSIGSNSISRKFPIDIVAKFCERYYDAPIFEYFFQFKRPENHIQRLKDLNITQGL